MSRAPKKGNASGWLLAAGLAALGCLIFACTGVHSHIEG